MRRSPSSKARLWFAVAVLMGAVAPPAWALDDLTVVLRPNGVINGGLGSTADDSQATWTLQAPSGYLVHSSAIAPDEFIWTGVQTSANQPFHSYRVDLGPNGVNSRVGATVTGKLIPIGPGGGPAPLPDFESNAINVDLDADTDNTGTISGTKAEDEAEDVSPGLILRVDDVRPIRLSVTRVASTIAWSKSVGLALYADAAATNTNLPTAIAAGGTVTVYAKAVTTSLTAGDQFITAICTPDDGNGTAGRDTVKATVLKLDLAIYNGGGDLDNGERNGPQGTAVADNLETSVGAYLMVNWDDDDRDGRMRNTGTWIRNPVPDLSESETTVVNEDNLAKLVPSMEPLGEKGIIELEPTNGGDKIRLWTLSTKGIEITLIDGKLTWDLSNAVQRADFSVKSRSGMWIEGITASGSQKDVEFVLRYKTAVNGNIIASDTVNATVVMINLANVVGREVDSDALAERGHVAIVGRFDGACVKADLVDATKYTVYESDGSGNWTAEEPGPREALLTNITAVAGREFFGSLAPFLTSFTNSSAMPNTVAGYTARLRVLGASRWLIDHTATISYEKFNAVAPAIGWNGALNTITDLRCDGFVEVCYEMNGINSWGKITTGGAPAYNITVAANQPDHNEWQFGDDPADGEDDFWAWLMPITQIGYADTYIDTHYPPFTSGNFNYTANDFRGTHWQSAFSQQGLITPTFP